MNSNEKNEGSESGFSGERFGRTRAFGESGRPLGDRDAQLIGKSEVYQIVGSAMAVLNGLGVGLREKPYENALIVEFGLRNIPYSRQQRFGVFYKGVEVSEYIPDLTAFNLVIVETKVVERIGEAERAQVLNYLRISGLKVGVILNFKHSKLEWERLVLDRQR